MNMRGKNQLRYLATMEGTHDLIHDMLEDGEALEFVNTTIKEHKQTEVLYGNFGSGLHLHLLTHSLGWQWPVYFRTPDGQLHKAETVTRLVDDIGRIGKAIVFEVKPDD